MATSRTLGLCEPNFRMSYAYNHNGQRIQQSSSGDITYYLWDELSPYGDVVLETDSLNQPTVSYVLGGMQVLSQTKYVYNPPESVSTVTRHLLPDGQGSTRLLTKPNGDAVASQAFEYSAFGDLLSTDTPDTRYLYTGQQYDAATDLYSLRARYYDPGVGRFLSRDTWAYNFQNPVKLNRYGYAMANPINRVDLTGYSSLIERVAINTRQFMINHVVGRPLREGALAGALGYGLGLMVYNLFFEPDQYGTMHDLALSIIFGAFLNRLNTTASQLFFVPLDRISSKLWLDLLISPESVFSALKTTLIYSLLGSISGGFQNMVSGLMSGAIYDFAGVFFGIATGALNALSITGDIWGGVIPDIGLLTTVAANTVANLISRTGPSCPILTC